MSMARDCVPRALIPSSIASVEHARNEIIIVHPMRHRIACDLVYPLVNIGSTSV